MVLAKTMARSTWTIPGSQLPPSMALLISPQNAYSAPWQSSPLLRRVQSSPNAHPVPMVLQARRVTWGTTVILGGLSPLSLLTVWREMYLILPSKLILFLLTLTFCLQYKHRWTRANIVGKFPHFLQFALPMSFKGWPASPERVNCSMSWALPPQSLHLGHPRVSTPSPELCCSSKGASSLTLLVVLLETTKKCLQLLVFLLRLPEIATSVESFGFLPIWFLGSI